VDTGRYVDYTYGINAISNLYDISYMLSAYTTSLGEDNEYFLLLNGLLANLYHTLDIMELRAA
jgi:hypothetical protein